jgi:aspartyl-tRNA(Asn)/glutamyl-tRNA(Gln) amidotransferase subunit B
VLTDDRQVSDYFQTLLTKVDDSKQAANWVQGEVMRKLNDDKILITDLKVQPDELAGIIQLINKGTISHTAGKKVFDHVASTGDAPQAAVEKLGLAQVSDSSELEGMVQKVLDDNPDAVAKYKAGKAQLLGFLMGQTMQASRGKGNPKVIQDLLRKMLDS